MRKIMVVDDEAVARNSLAKIIDWRSFGFSAPVLASNGREALQLVETGIPDVVITDIRMPVVDGIELAKRLYEQYPDILVIIVSGYNDFDYARKAIEYGVLSYLLKPVSKDDILNLGGKLIKELDRKSKSEPLAGGVYSDCVKDLMYYKLLYGSVQSCGEYTAMKTRLGDELFNRYGCVAAFEADFFRQSADRNEIQQELYDFAQSYWKNYNFPVLRDKDYVLAILNYETMASGMSIESLIRRFKESMQTNPLCKYHSEILISAGIGRMYKGYRYLSESYKEALKALQYKFFKGKGSLVFYDDVLREISDGVVNSGGSANDMSILCAEINEAKGTVHSSLVHFCNRLLSAFGSDKPFLIAKCLEAYSAIVEKTAADPACTHVLKEKELYTLLSGYNTGSEMMLAFKDVLGSLIQTTMEHKKRNANPVVQRVIKFIEANYSSDLSVAKIAESIKMNPSYLSSVFKDHTGILLSDFIMTVRINRAKHLLSATDKLVRDIAAEVGFPEYRYFCRVFKMNTMMTPQEYKTRIVLEKGAR